MLTELTISSCFDFKLSALPILYGKPIGRELRMEVIIFTVKIMYSKLEGKN